MPNAPGGGRLPPILLLQMTGFVSTLDRFVMPPMLIAIAHDLGVPLSAIVQAAGIYFLAYGLSQPVWGSVSDYLGLVRTMRLTLLLAGIATIASAFVTTPLMLALARGVAGGFFGAAYPSALIYVGDTVPADRRQHDIARLMVGVALGTALASVGSGLLAHLFTWRAAFVTTGIFALALAVTLRRLPSPTEQRTHRHVLSPVLHVFGSRAATFVLGLAFLEGAVVIGVLTLLPPAVESSGATPALAGAVTGVYGIAVYVSSRAVARLSRTQHPSRLIGLGATAGLAACLVLVVSRSPVTAVLVAVLLGIAWVSMHSSLQTWATEVLPSSRATVVSLFAGSLFVGSAVSAVLVADLAQHERYRDIFLLAAAVMVPLGLLATWGRARWRRPGEPA